MKNGNTIKQHITAKQPRVTAVAGPQTISFRKIKRKRRAKTAAQAQIQRPSTPVAEVLIGNGKKPAKSSLNKAIQKSKTGKRKQRK